MVTYSFHLYSRSSHHFIQYYVFFCEHEQWSNVSCEQRALFWIQLAKSEHFKNFPWQQFLFVFISHSGLLECAQYRNFAIISRPEPKEFTPYFVTSRTFAQCERSRIYESLSNGTNLNENPSMRTIAKFLRARASEHSSKFCEQIEQRPNLASTWKFLWPFDTTPLQGKKICIHREKLSNQAF